MPTNAPVGPGPGTTMNHPAISGTGTGMGAGNAAGPGAIGGVQAGTINDAAQGAQSGAAGDPSLGSGMAVPERGNRMGDAATGGAQGIKDAPLSIGAAPIEPLGLPYKIVYPAGPGR